MVLHPLNYPIQPKNVQSDQGNDLIKNLNDNELIFERFGSVVILTMSLIGFGLWIEIGIVIISVSIILSL